MAYVDIPSDRGTLAAPRLVTADRDLHKQELSHEQANRSRISNR